MGFYEQISKFYDYIFPVGSSQLDFIRKVSGEPPKEILDVACGSGGYSLELAKYGYHVTAVDADDEMVRLAREKADASGARINALKCDMRDMEGTLNTVYNCVFCIGNSLVHLGSLDEITDVLKQMNTLLPPGGALVLQVINYDRIMKYGVSELPVIRNEDVGLEFVRMYEYLNESGMINFNTVLTVKSGTDTGRFVNTVKLLPLRSADMLEALTDAGYRDIRFYGDFQFSDYNDSSYMLVVKATR